MIVFFFSFKEPGGVPSLFYNLATFLKEAKVAFRLVCHNDSEVYDLFNKLETKFEYVDYESISKNIIETKFSRDDILLITYWDPKLFLFKVKNPKIIFWNVYPDTIYNSNRVWGNFIYHSQNKKLLEIMLLKNGLYFMDDAPLEWMGKYHYQELASDLYLPIPIKTYGNQYHFNNMGEKTLRLAYISRCESWKLYPLLKIIEDLSKLKNKITINIVTDNISNVKVFLRTNLTNAINKNINIKYFEKIPNNIIHSFLLSKIDLNIGMGTACLEGAKIGIPTLLVNPSKDLIADNYRYIWLYETKNFNLGRFYEYQAEYDGLKLNDIIERCFSDPNYLNDESIKCYDYVLNYHDLKDIGQQALDRIINTNLRVGDVINKVHIYSHLYKIKKTIKEI